MLRVLRRHVGTLLLIPKLLPMKPLGRTNVRRHPLDKLKDTMFVALCSMAGSAIGINVV